MNQDEEQTNPAAPGRGAEEAAGSYSSPAGAGAAAEQPGGGYSDPGLFGKLPRSRPGARSPRRGKRRRADSAAGKDEGGSAEAASPAPAGAKAARGEGAGTPTTRRNTAPPPPPEAQRPAAEGPEEAGGGIEELAWAGIAVTAEAATLGVRLLSRAIDAARRATERR